jgi:serine phosphatase RsbU (regulator of sigma subunit)
VVCSNALHRSVKEFGLREPGEVLDKVTELILETFSKSGNQVKDGMDISLCCFDLQAKMVWWAGANNPLWIARGGEMLTLEADHQPVGLHEFAQKFTTQQLPLEDGDMLYLFSDGYADQFGGEKGKKLKTANLRKLLLASATLPAVQQRALLEQHFHSWRGSLEQVDDVLVIGIRV